MNQWIGGKLVLTQSGPLCSDGKHGYLFNGRHKGYILLFEQSKDSLVNVSEREYKDKNAYKNHKP